MGQRHNGPKQQHPTSDITSRGDPMVKKLPLLLTFLALFAWAAYAQTSSTSQQGQSGSDTHTNATEPNNTGNTANGPSAQRRSDQDQQGSSSATGSMDQNQSGSATSGQSMEGCIVQEETDYYLQPENGQRIKLNGSPDVKGNVGHHVRVHGNLENGSSSGTAANSAGSQTSEASPHSGASQAGNGQQMLVTRVDSIAETCPYTPHGQGSGMAGSSGGSSSQESGMSGSSGSNSSQGTGSSNSGTSSQSPR